MIYGSSSTAISIRFLFVHRDYWESKFSADYNDGMLAVALPSLDSTTSTFENPTAEDLETIALSIDDHFQLMAEHQVSDMTAYLADGQKSLEEEVGE